MQLIQGNQLELPRCPHCSIARPLMPILVESGTKNHWGLEERVWRVYACTSCGGAVLTGSQKGGNLRVTEMYPLPKFVRHELPTRAAEYLSQAIESLNAPAGAVVLAASAVDAMLKDLGLKDGTLSQRIEVAAERHLITADMAEWAHEVRLDANNQRHADEAAPLPTADDAKRVLEFATALGDFLFVFPARVKRGRGKNGNASSVE